MTPNELREHADRVRDAEPFLISPRDDTPCQLLRQVIVDEVEWQSARVLAEEAPKLLEQIRQLELDIRILHD